MASLLVLGGRADGGDLHRGEGLPVTGLAAVALPALVLEDDDLLAQAVLDDLGLDGHAADRGTADGDVPSVVSHEERSERELRPGGAGELLDTKGLPLADA